MQKTSRSHLFLLAAVVVAIAAAAAFGLTKLHQANVASRELRLERLLRTKTATKAVSKELTGDVADYSSAYSSEGHGRPQEEASAIADARAANDRIAGDLDSIARAYAALYGDPATQRLRADAALAHAACARSLQAWARANDDASKREDQACEKYGMQLGDELDGLGSKLDADVAATRTSLWSL